MHRSYYQSEEIDCSCFDFAPRSGLIANPNISYGNVVPRYEDRRYTHQHSLTAYVAGSTPKTSLKRPKVEEQPPATMLKGMHRRGQRSIVNQVSMSIVCTGLPDKADKQNKTVETSSLKSQHPSQKQNFVTAKVKGSGKDFLKHKEKSSNFQKLAAQQISLKSIVGPSVHFIAEDFNSQSQKDGFASDKDTQMKTTKVNSQVVQNNAIGTSQLYDLLKFSQKLLASNKNIIINKKRTSMLKNDGFSNFHKKDHNSFYPREIESFYDEQPEDDESFVIEKFRIGEVPDGSGKIIGFYVPSNFKFKQKLQRRQSSSRRESRRNSKRMSKRISSNFVMQ